MDDKPKNRLSLKRTNQRKLDFKPKQVQDDNKATTDVTDTNSSDGPPLSGLCNLGNTCYVNSLLQTLRFCPSLYQRVVQLNELLLEQQNKDCKEEELSNGVTNGVMELSNNSEPMECSNSESELATKKQVTLSMHLYMLWQRMSQKEKTFIRTTNKVTTLTATRPDAFIAKLKEDHPIFDNKLQQDAQEMLRYLLTNLHETCMKVLLHPPKSTGTKHLPSIPNAQDTSGTEKSTVPAVIDVESYQENSTKRPVIGMKRKLMGRPSTKGGKFAYKRLSDYYTPVKQQKLSQVKPPSDGGKTKEGVHQTRHLDFVRGTFQGTLAYQMKCFECENYTRRTEEFLDVSVPVVSTSLPGFPAGASPMKSRTQENVHTSSSTVGPCSLSWALSQFALREKLRRDNKYFCDCCGHFVEAERSVLFSHLPSIITVHLNRFTTQIWGLSSSITVNKVSGNIAVPLSLCLKPWCTNDCKNKERIYELFSVVFHSGTSCSSGHYTSCVRAKECVSVAPSEAQIEQDQWLYFDDDLVEYLPQHKLLEMLSPLSNDSCTPYILFYNSTPRECL